MTKKVLLIVVLFISITISAQKAQRIGYIDMEYILENLPEYNESQAKINAKALTWQSNLEKIQNEIDVLKENFANEKELLTKDLVAEREEDIEIKKLELKTLKAAYFGTKGDLYFLRQQLVKPIQDLVFNAVQDIAKKRKYDFVLDKSNSLIMLYTNKSFDISDLVIKSITRIKKTNDALAKKEQRKKDIEAKAAAAETEPNEEVVKKLSDREAKRAALLKKIEEKKAAQLKKREELKAAIEAKRLKRIQEIEDAKKEKEASETEDTEEDETKKEEDEEDENGSENNNIHNIN